MYNNYYIYVDIITSWECHFLTAKVRWFHWNSYCYIVAFCYLCNNYCIVTRRAGDFIPSSVETLSLAENEVEDLTQVHNILPYYLMSVIAAAVVWKLYYYIIMPSFLVGVEIVLAEVAESAISDEQSLRLHH